MANYGTPTRVVANATGTRLQYSRQPAGQSAVMVDINTADKVTAVREMMTLQELSKIEPGKWTREDVEREFGPPARVDRVASWPGDIMNYRWRDSLQDMFFWVYLDAGQVVGRTGQGHGHHFYHWHVPETQDGVTAPLQAAHSVVDWVQRDLLGQRHLQRRPDAAPVHLFPGGQLAADCGGRAVLG